MARRPSFLGPGRLIGAYDALDNPVFVAKYVEVTVVFIASSYICILRKSRYVCKVTLGVTFANCRTSPVNGSLANV